ncbi:MAG TPA: hypothetical protein VFI23_10670 [Rhizomicrobium sp.]|nr:hypothetical protein [Rhizomicrobium sp.]
MRLISSFLALTLSATAALAGDLTPLRPGAPAGVKQAQEFNHTTALYLVVGAAVVAGIAVAASSGNDGTAPTNGGTTTTTTTTTTS